MKKTLLVAAVAAILVFAFTSAAFAVDHSGEMRRGPAAVTGAPVGGGGSNPTNNVAGAGTYTYVDWSTGLGGNNSGISLGANSPHGAFTTTTVKCAVCHAIHYAAPGNAPVGSGQTADTLLKMTANNACAYCHVVAGQTVNGRSVYDGIFPASSGGSTTVGHAIGTNCNECHSSVHGSGADISVPAITGYLLKTGGPNTTVLNSIKAIDATAAAQGFTAGAAAANQTVTGFDEATWASTNTAAMREQAVGIFCAQCHAGSYTQTQSGAQTNVSGAGTAGVNQGAAIYSGHRTMATATAVWSGHSSGSYNGQGQIAWADAASCKSCHDAKDTLGNQGFPHSWGGTKEWLVAAPSATEATVALPYGPSAPYNNYTSGATQLSDGVCLKCHRHDSTTSGVGLSF